MKLEIDWQVLNDEDEWEPIVAPPSGRRRRMRWWVWAALAATLVVAGTGGYALVYRRYNGALRRIAFELQNVIGLESAALAQGRVELFLAQQDRAIAGWYGRQVQQVRLAANSKSGNRLTPVRVRSVAMNGGVAWVEVLSYPDRLRQARFYRQTKWGWVHTAPDAAFWGDAVQIERDGVTLRYHERDQPHIERLVDRVLAVVTAMRGQLRCADPPMLEVSWVAEDRLPDIVDWTVVLPSPWLTGIPADDRWSEAALDELTYWAAYGAASQCVRTLGVHPPSDRALTPLQRALASEYATWYVRGDLDRTPILRRVAAQHNVTSLPQAVYAAAGATSVPEFMDRWLLRTVPASESAYLALSWDIAHEADATGQAPTCQLFLSLSGDTGGAQWAGQIARLPSCSRDSPWAPMLEDR